MGVNKINFIEQHVEKMVLGAAALGALFIGYLAFQPISIPGDAGHPDPLGPNDIESTIDTALNGLDNAQKNLPKPEPKVKDYLEDYNKLTKNSPLDNAVLATANFPLFGPKNLQPKLVNEDTISAGMASVTPNPVAPEMLRAEARQDQVAIDQVNPVPAGMQAQTRTQNSVVIDGYIPLGKMLVQMLQEKDKARISLDSVQRSLVYRINVERREVTGGTSNDWTVVPATKGSPSPADVGLPSMKDGELAAKMDLIDADFKQIVLPDFYKDGQGAAIVAPILARPIPKDIADESRKLQSDIDNLKSASMGLRAAAGTAPAGADQPTTFPADITALKSLPVVPFTFWDETVQPNHTYQYRVEVLLVNPTYGWKWGLANPKMKTVATISAGKFPIGQSVTVHSDIAFFIRNGGGGGFGGGSDVTGMIFKQEGGKWYQGEFSVRLGENIAASVPLVGITPVKNIDVDTGFAVVDAVPEGSSARVVLKDPAGNLISRDAAADWDSPDRTKLADQVQKRVVAAPPATQDSLGSNTLAPAPNRGPVPVRPNTPRGPVPPGRGGLN